MLRTLLLLAVALALSACTGGPAPTPVGPLLPITGQGWPADMGPDDLPWPDPPYGNSVAFPLTVIADSSAVEVYCFNDYDKRYHFVLSFDSGSDTRTITGYFTPGKDHELHIHYGGLSSGTGHWKRVDITSAAPFTLDTRE